jgi:hypothetical protein
MFLFSVLKRAIHGYGPYLIGLCQNVSNAQIHMYSISTIGRIISIKQRRKLKMRRRICINAAYLSEG